MEYRRLDNVILLRLDRGEEIVAQLQELASKENIRLASVRGLGAVNNFTVGVFDTETKKYASNSFQGAYEITSLVGTIDTMNGEVYTHIHFSAANGSGQVFGGHLNKAVISATGEIVVSLINGQINRTFNADVGLNLFDFS